VVNADHRIQKLTKCIDLGSVDKAEVIEPSQQSQRSINSVENEDVMQPMITNLPSQLTEEQRGAVRQLLQESELSMGWVDPWVGLGWFWVGSTTAKVLKI